MYIVEVVEVGEVAVVQLSSGAVFGGCDHLLTGLDCWLLVEVLVYLTEQDDPSLPVSLVWRHLGVRVHLVLEGTDWLVQCSLPPHFLQGA